MVHLFFFFRLRPSLFISVVNGPDIYFFNLLSKAALHFYLLWKRNKSIIIFKNNIYWSPCKLIKNFKKKPLNFMHLFLKNIDS